MVKKNEEESPRALKEEELQSVNGGFVILPTPKGY